METFTVSDLAEAAGDVLDTLGVHVGNGRVRERPDARTVRYYGQLGLVDRPLPAPGRTARYGRRHLLQVVAVKRLQAGGVSLADVQRRLTGATDDELAAAAGPDAVAAIARVPAPEGVPVPAAEPAGGPARRFWAARPAPARTTPDGVSADRTVVATAPAPERRTATQRVVVVPLAAGVRLALDEDVLRGRDPAALVRAAAPLLDLLRETDETDDEGSQR